MPHIPLPQNQIKPNKASASDRDLISGAIRAVAFWIGKRLRIQMVILLELSETSDYIAAVDCVWTKAKPKKRMAALRAAILFLGLMS
jgi:hypothetical protein